MQRFFQRALSVFLALAIVCGFFLPERVTFAQEAASPAQESSISSKDGEGQPSEKTKVQEEGPKTSPNPLPEGELPSPKKAGGGEPVVKSNLFFINASHDHPYYGGDPIVVYNDVRVSGNAQPLPGNNQVRVILPKNSFVDMEERDISLGNTQETRIKWIQLLGGNFLLIYYDTLEGGYNQATSIFLKLLPRKTIHGKKYSITHKFLDKDSHELCTSTFVITGKADMETVTERDPNQSYEDMKDQVDENHIIRPGTYVKFSPYWVKTGDRTDPRSRRISVSLPDGLSIKENTGWTKKDPGSNLWIKEIKGEDIDFDNYSPKVDVSGIDLSNYKSKENAKELTLSFTSEILDPEGQGEPLPPIHWEVVKKLYKGKRPDANWIINTKREQRYVDENGKPIQNSEYHNSTKPTLFLPHKKEDLKNYLVDFRHSPIATSFFKNSLGMEDQRELCIKHTETEVADYTYAKKIGITIKSQGLKEEEIEILKKKLQGTKARGLTQSGTWEDITDNVPIGEEDHPNFYLLEPGKYSEISFIFPNQGVRLKGAEEIRRYQWAFDTHVTCGIKPEAIDALQAKLDKGETELTVGDKSNKWSSTSYSVKYYKTEGQPLYEDHNSKQDYTRTAFSWKYGYDKITEKKPIAFTLPTKTGATEIDKDENGVFIVKETDYQKSNKNLGLETELTYKHETTSKQGQKPENLTLYYLIPESMEPDELAGDFQSVRVERDYREGYDLVIAKPKPETIPIPQGSQPSVNKTYHMVFYPTARMSADEVYNIRAALCINNNDLKDVEGETIGILQENTPKGPWENITRFEKNGPELKDKFTDLGELSFKIYPPLTFSAVLDAKRSNTDEAFLSVLKKGRVGGHIDYRWQLKNASTEKVKELTIIDILPFKGDRSIVKNRNGDYVDRGSKFKTPLTGPIQHEKFIFSYSTGEVQGTVEQNFNAKFLKEEEITDWSKVTMIKAVLKKGEIIDVGEEINITTHNMIEDNQLLEDGDAAFNSFAYTTNGGKDFLEVIKSEVRINYPKRNVEILKYDSKFPWVYLRGVEFNLFLVTSTGDKLVKEGIVTDENGKALLEDLLVGKDYYLKETKAAEGYFLHRNKKHFFRIPDEGKDEYAPDDVYQVKIKNRPYPHYDDEEEEPKENKADEFPSSLTSEHHHRSHLPTKSPTPFCVPLVSETPSCTDPDHPNPCTGARP